MIQLNAAEIKNKVIEFANKGSIREKDEAVARLAGLMFSKAKNNLKLSNIIYEISNKGKDTFYDWVIITSYYAMFHAANALLAVKNIKVKQPFVHEATRCAFAYYYIINQELAEELFLLYKDAEAKAKSLFDALSEEKKKRGDFTYERLPKANRPPAEESIKNASEFLTAIENVLTKKRVL